MKTNITTNIHYVALSDLIDCHWDDNREYAKENIDEVIASYEALNYFKELLEKEGEL